MPIKKSAKKYMRVTERKHARNLKLKSAYKSAIKDAMNFVKQENKEAANKTYILVQEALDKAAKAGIIKQNTAARKKSRIVKRLKAIAAK